MNLGRCPVCHSRLHLDALVQDESGRGLLALLAQQERTTGAALVSYLSLFRAKSRDLANDRALRIATEALELAPVQQLVPAMAHTVEQMRAKQQAGGFKPLANHNYLKRVLESRDGVQAEGDIQALPHELQAVNGQGGKRAAVTNSLMNIRDTDW